MPNNVDMAKFCSAAIEQARKSRAEDDRTHPLVGAVLVDTGACEGQGEVWPNGKQGAAFRGELSLGEHAEYTLLERKLAQEQLHDRRLCLFATLEPCMVRKEPKIPCAERIVKRGVHSVCIGMLDPDPVIWGKGLWFLRSEGVQVDYFPRALRVQIEEMNDNFVRDRLEQFNRRAFDKRLPRVFVDPDDPYFDAAYGLFRTYPGGMVVFYNTHLQMFADKDEFYVWWASGLLKNEFRPNVLIAATREMIEAKIINSPLREVLKEELAAADGLPITVNEIECGEFTGIFFLRFEGGVPVVEYGMFLLGIPAGGNQRVILVVGRDGRGQYDAVLDEVARTLGPVIAQRNGRNLLELVDVKA